jgi:hypothetical protein
MAEEIPKVIRRVDPRLSAFVRNDSRLSKPKIEFSSGSLEFNGRNHNHPLHSRTTIGGSSRGPSTKPAELQ